MSMRLQARGDRGVVQSVVLFLGVSVLSGALAAGLVIPFAGLLGFGTEKTSETFEKLPTELQQQPLPVRSRIVAADGSQIAYIYDQNRVNVRLSQVTSIMKKAIIAVEDSRFYEHGALDAKGTLRALARNKAADGVTQGGSSITQQLVKMTLIQQAATEAEQKAATAETYERKIKELRYAVALEKQFTKDQILERYLNIAYFGDGAYGVEAAARHYYRTTAGKLTLAQAATLAGLVKNPGGYDPTNYPTRAKDRRDVVLHRMQDLKLITPQQSAAAMKQPVIDMDHLGRVPNGCANSRYPFYCEYVVAKLLDNPSLGKTRAERERMLKTGGLTITTSLDPSVQAKTQAAVNAKSKPTDNTIVAMTVVQPGTGLVKAMAQSRPYGNDKKQGETVFNFNTERSYPGGFGGFQNGSTMKAFTIAAAIRQGVPLSYKINSPDTIDLGGKKWKTCGGHVTAEKDYRPKNSTRGGDLDLIHAAMYSTNTYFLQLSQRIGLCGITTLATQLGVVNGKTTYNPVYKDGKVIGKKVYEQQGKPLVAVPSYTLGVGNVTPLMLSNAYATFAARGKYCTPTVITSIKNKLNSPLPTPGANCIQAMQQAYADGVNKVLWSVVNEPGGTGNRMRLDRPTAGKTGTVNDNKAVWFIGYTPDYAGATVVSDADPPQNNLARGHTLNGRHLSDVSGSGTAGPIWKLAMSKIEEGLPVRGFPQPDGRIVKGQLTKLPQTAGMSIREASDTLRAAGFDVDVASERVRSTYPEGTVAYTDPRWYDGAPSGTTVVLHVSNGQPPEPPKPPTPPPTTPPTTTPPKPPKPPPTCPPWKPGCPRR
jgi:membrane peptidoglycan carboxypeptidase